MIKKILFIFVLIIFAGCVTVDNKNISVMDEHAQNNNKFTYTVVENALLHKGYFPFRRSLNRKKYGYLTLSYSFWLRPKNPISCTLASETQIEDCLTSALIVEKMKPQICVV